VVSRPRILRDVEREGHAGTRGLRRKSSFFGGLPAVLHERLHGDYGFVHSQMEYTLSFLEFRGKSLDVHPLLPESGRYFAGQSGAPGNPKLKLFHLRHHLSYTPYETQEKAFRLLGKRSGKSPSFAPRLVPLFRAFLSLKLEGGALLGLYDPGPLQLRVNHGIGILFSSISLLSCW
jgi:hypothetical protein